MLLYIYIMKSVNDFVSGVNMCPVPLSNTGVMGALSLKGIVGIDWLQVSFWGCPTESDFLTFKVLSYSTKIFKKVADVFYYGELIGNMTYEPISPIIPAGTLIFKFDNSVLYKYDCIKMIGIVGRGLGLLYKGITRIDLFSDFNRFSNNLLPANLIGGFLNSKYIKVNNSKFDVRGKNGDSIKFEYLKFGANTSDVCCYLYNKSVEMLEVKHKPYILDRWKALNLDVSNDVWRLEFSIKKCNYDVISKITGEVNMMSMEFFDLYSNIYNLYFSLVDKYFRFVHNDGNAKKNRNRSVCLFSNDYDPLKLIETTYALNSKRANKIFIKHMHLYNLSLKGSSIYGDIDRYNVLMDYIKLHDLLSWYNAKIRDIECSPVVL